MELLSRNRGMRNMIKIESEIQESNGHTKYQENCDSSTTSCMRLDHATRLLLHQEENMDQG